MLQKIQQVCDAFRIPGTLLSYEEIKRGNINHTYKVNFCHINGKPKSYIVQKINTEVFHKPIEVMDNIDQVTEYIHATNPGKTVLHFHHTEDRKTYWFEGNNFWRLFNYIPSQTYDASEDLEIIWNAGYAFGEFQVLLRKFDAGHLHETIPGFHDTIQRYDTLMAHVKQDPYGRVAQVREELDWLLSVREKACAITELRRKGELPLRVTHNDTKINNVLFEQEGKEAIVVIDLDTVMPGLVGHDFGDAIRFAANREAEDSKNYQNAGVNMEIFGAFADGFLKQTASALTQKEVDTLALSCFDMTCELATRFMDDYIMGDKYFKTRWPGHNLDRTRCQVALAQDMERRMEEMEDVVRDCAAQYRHG